MPKSGISRAAILPPPRPKVLALATFCHGVGAERHMQTLFSFELPAYFSFRRHILLAISRTDLHELEQ